MSIDKGYTNNFLIRHWVSLSKVDNRLSVENIDSRKKQLQYLAISYVCPEPMGARGSDIKGIFPVMVLSQLLIHLLL